MRVGACEHRDFSLYESRQFDTDDKVSVIQFLPWTFGSSLLADPDPVLDRARLMP